MHAVATLLHWSLGTQLHWILSTELHGLLGTPLHRYSSKEMKVGELCKT